ncbi:T9SS type A sorting domain-containing protein [Pontibacter sp. BT310]|uniref:T9SS type A sorting domain-containing protein n=1 Tax=Pontibacter populi TaxID=890055 RepID=A0ABS6X978_9BACT|nr:MULTISPECIES: T9SS type A sorting domain-containing protein [Pontibacter]MBJ6117708.1 T9SS type A sorting domain-containing protein [Pontibacter sp. BT310]MBR0570134.1 T9SS type A sorting domain-containing protein [Microvirga sp. STS03]MBW3364560.1 T9SS type A sorting domain-containing protein [Pontibacter populi]
MKQFYITLFTFLVFTFSASAQVLLHHENFNQNTQGTLTGVVANPAGSWVGSSAIPSTLPQSSRGGYARTNANGTKRLSIAFSTLGYSNATITWEQFRNNFKNTNFPLTSVVELQYSVNSGVTRTTFYKTTNNTNDIWNKVNNGTPIALPAVAMGMPEVRIYWQITFTNESNETAYYAIDDVTVIGTPETGISTFDWTTRPVDENPFVASGTTSATPYLVDGITMRWSSALSNGVSYESTKVDNKTYKAGTKSFTLVQLSKATTAGSVIQLDLNQPVEDLTFTVFDVDVAQNQFTDKLTITGYYNGTPVQLVKNKVKTTSNNQFASSALTGLTATDNTSGEGDVTVSFPQPVTRVVIQYSNASATQNANGRQGMAIHNISWRKEQVIAPLPVELVSFKAKREQNTTILTWATASEKNNDRFDVERSQDGKHFSKIGEITGNGNSNRTLNYTYTDNRPATGVSYYRLRQVDYDGTIEFSKTITVNFAAPKAGAAIAQVFPTVATDQVTIAFTTAAGTTDVAIVDASGRTIAMFAQVADFEKVVPVQNLQAGIYFVTVTNGQVRETYRFLKK